VSLVDEDACRSRQALVKVTALFAEPTADQVRVFLRSHTDFLERFVMEEVELEILERWVIRSTQRAKKRPDATSAGKS
jgi:hypothetical protein